MPLIKPQTAKPKYPSRKVSVKNKENYDAKLIATYLLSLSPSLCGQNEYQSVNKKFPGGFFPHA